jgi:hypothetical protein
MKVKELQAKLSGFDPEQYVLCCCEDGDQASKDRGLKLFEIIDVNVSDLEMTRLDDGTPYLRTGTTPLSVHNVVISITGGF